VNHSQKSPQPFLRPLLKKFQNPSVIGSKIQHNQILFQQFFSAKGELVDQKAHWHCSTMGLQVWRLFYHD
jgi:hypothetical protein